MLRILHLTTRLQREPPLKGKPFLCKHCALFRRDPERCFTSFDPHVVRISTTLRMTRRGVKISNFVLFLRVAEGVDPYINEVCANIVRSIVGRGFISRRF